MARVSRKPAAFERPVVQEHCGHRSFYRTAAYIRQSHEEQLQGGQSSKLENQEQVIRNFLQENKELRLAKVYADNGYSGTNFSRPSFMEMLKDAQAGKIQCIVVKDLSRLGRNYIETEQYIRLIFPKLKVRFIAVNDGFDSLQEDLDLTASLKNIINDAYARDISQKIFTTKQAQQQRGEFVGNLPPYGYQKSAWDPHQLVIDPEVSPAVRRLFQMKLEGKTCTEIARRMNEEGYPAPMAYRYQKGLVHQERYAASVWERSTVKTLLQNRMYTGDMVQGKKRRCLAEGQKKTKICAPDEYVVVPDRHEPVIGRKEFQQVQEILEQETAKNRKTRRKYQEVINPEDLLQGKIESTEGKKMYRGRHVYENGRVTYYYITAGSLGQKEAADPCAYISEKNVMDILKKIIKIYMEMLVSIDHFFQSPMIQRALRCRKEMNVLRITRLEKEQKRQQDKLVGLYRDFRKYLIDKENYLALKKKCRQEYDTCGKQLELLYKEVDDGEDMLKKNCLERYRKFLQQPSLTRELVNDLVEKIQVEGKTKVHVSLAFADEIKGMDLKMKGERLL